MFRKKDPEAPVPQARVYRYGSRPPAEGAEIVEEQMYLAHRYKNALVHRERLRRRKVERLVLSLSPELAAIEERLPALEAAQDQAYQTLRAAHSEARARTRPPALVAAYQEAKRAIAQERLRRKELRKALFSAPEWDERSRDIEALDERYGKRLRAASGLYWGTYLHVEQCMDKCRQGAPPEFRRWDEGGHLAVQIQNGMSVPDVFGEDQRVRIEPVPKEAWLPGGRRLRRTRVHVRVGSGPKGKPVFAVFPIVLHRPMPKDARIKWVHVVRRRIATHCEWSVQFVLAREAGAWRRDDLASDGRVGIDVGWRKRPDGSLRVAYWVGDRGEEGELALPKDWLEQMQKVRDIQSIRDRLRDEILPVLGAGLKEVQVVPDQVARTLPYMAQIKSQDRLRRFIEEWRTTFRFDGDAEIFEKAEAWRKRDKHLYEYEGNLRDQLQRRRLDLYRVFAAKIRRQYKTVAVECLDLRDFHELPDADEPMPPEMIKKYVRDACLSSLFGTLKQSGGTMDVLPAPYTTLVHASCGSVQEFDRTKLHNTCTKCGERYDQDRNAAINLLHGSSAPVSAAVS